MKANLDTVLADTHWVNSTNCSEENTLELLTLKPLGHFFQNVISFFYAVHLMCYSFIWNWFNTTNV